MKNPIKFSIWLLSLITFFIMVSCHDDDGSKIVSMRLNHYVQPTTPYYTHGNTFYYVQEGEAIGSTEWEMFGAHISGLDYELGYVYDVLVKVTPQDKNIADGPGALYSLWKIKKKTKVSDDVIFKITLARGEPISENYTVENNGIYTTVNDINIECGTLCADLSDKISGLHTNEYVYGVFEHVDKNTIRLTDVGVKLIGQQ